MVYAVVFTSALIAVGPHVLATASAPLSAAVRAGSLSWLAPAVRIGASVATLGVLLSLLAGVSRTVFAMAANHDFAVWFAAVHARHRVPYRAELATGIVVIAVVATADLRGAIGFSSFAVLAYYAIANASSYTLAPGERRWPRAYSVFGIVGCVVLALSLPWGSIIGGVVLLALGAAVWLTTRVPATDRPVIVGYATAARAASYSALARGVPRSGDEKVEVTVPSESSTKVARLAQPRASLNTP